MWWCLQTWLVWSMQLHIYTWAARDLSKCCYVLPWQELVWAAQFAHHSSIWPIDRTFSSVTTPGQSGPGSDGNEGVLYIPLKFQHCWNLTIRLFCVICRTPIRRVLTLCKAAVKVFNSTCSRLGILRSNNDKMKGKITVYMPAGKLEIVLIFH